MPAYISINDPAKVCQYWIVDEPPTCNYWSSGCTCSNTTGKLPTFKPYCNFIGTQVSCDAYEAGKDAKPEARCVLPDPFRHVCNRHTGKKWASFDSGALECPDITGYNSGKCNDLGTDFTCKGYSPYHMGFGALVPSKLPHLDSGLDLGTYSNILAFGVTLPINYVIYNIRAKVARCYWWRGPIMEFGVTVDGYISYPKDSWYCSLNKSIYSDFIAYSPPCNGCKPECSNYIGTCWKYCIESKLDVGDFVLAEQVHELRYYYRENVWTVEKLEKLFIDEGHIYAWEGKLEYDVNTDGSIVNYKIPAIHTYMDSFDKFLVKTEFKMLTQGTAVSTYSSVVSSTENFPSLVREISPLKLSPIIQNVFNKIIGLEDINLFETSSLGLKNSMLVYGKVFYTTDTIALNISDKELYTVLPKELYEFDDVYELEDTMSVEEFKKFNTELLCKLLAIMSVVPDKCAANMLPLEDSTFIMDVPLLTTDKTFDQTNNNIIFVFQVVSGVVTYNKITVTKRIIGGMLFQTEFSILGDGKPVKLPIPYFERSFLADMYHNGSMSFKFLGFESEGFITSVKYMYSESVIRHPLDGGGSVAFKEYEITIDKYILESAELRVIGGNGAILITLAALEVHSVVRPFEIEKIEIIYGDAHVSCEMKILHHGADGKLLANQLLIEPKDRVEFKTFCEDKDAIVLTKLVYWERRSFKEVPESVLGVVNPKSSKSIYNTFSDISDTIGNLVVDIDENTFTVDNYEFALVPTAVMLDSTGRCFTQCRTKAIGLVNQVACPDVEIKYAWQSNYDVTQNVPICWPCCGAHSEKPLNRSFGSTYSPRCGDHFTCIDCFPSEVWWPYNRCDNYAAYDIITNFNWWDVSKMGLFLGANKDINGAHNMRMLGPAKAMAWTGTGCGLKACNCGLETFNARVSSGPTWVGYGKIRGGVSTADLLLWRLCGSNPVMSFGNENRSVLRSYLTIDSALYVYTDYTYAPARTTVEAMLMPASSVFSVSDITAKDDAIWDYFCADGQPNVVNPLGFFLESGETLVQNRYRFEEIIRCRFSSCMGYPKAANEYVQVIGDCVVNPWYEFKKVDVGTIYWAWQEVWKPLIRYANKQVEFSELISVYSEQLQGTKITTMKGAFIDDEGCFIGVDILYPKYRYDWQCEEFRVIIEEGAHALCFVAPVKDSTTGVYSGYPAFKIDDGPMRGFTIDGEWLTKDTDKSDVAVDKFNTTLYEKCTDTELKAVHAGRDYKDKWADDVTLFSSDTDKEDGIVYRYEGEDIVRTYFKHGLNVKLSVGALTALPIKVSICSDPTIESFLIDAQNKLSTEIAGFSSQDIIGDSEYSVCFSFDGKKTSVGGVKGSFKFGKKELSDAELNDIGMIPAIIDGQKVKYYQCFNIPSVNVYSAYKDTSDKWVLGELLFESEMKVVEWNSSSNVDIVSISWQWENNFKYVMEGADAVWIKFRSKPTEQELLVAGRTEANKTDDEFIDCMHVTLFEVYEDTLVDATENLELFERKYNISYKDVANPTQGDGSAQVFRKCGADTSTYWQQDDMTGVVGVSGSDGDMVFENKTHKRTVSKVYKDGELLTGEPQVMEDVQKQLYDYGANKVVTKYTLRGVLPIGLESLLSLHNVKFKGPDKLNLTNTLVTPLAGINHYPVMTPEGHLYVDSAIVQRYGCPKDPCGGNGFWYSYQSQDGANAGGWSTGGALTETSAIEQYYGGTAWIMQRREMAINLHIGLYVMDQKETANKIYTDSAFFNYSYSPMPIKHNIGGLSQSIPVMGKVMLGMMAAGFGAFWGTGMSSADMGTSIIHVPRT